MAKKVDRTIDDFDKTMKLLLASLGGIPLRTGSFHKQHNNLARDVALLVVELDSARGFIT